ncbi:hypothetical protein [Spirosoma linguale]|uniref:Outer membrane protein beta-barrel domain-containing protein n=1 Tax=Spirosoma linguale (strain ATCC 33905 / DSM 74 / LMG 10896 / Claus 1) TaxID=504472 RepID=D2QJ81_SPILD|nr:hypothetical protein Slin_2779 [Spirosoma linguale DSM 74]
MNFLHVLALTVLTVGAASAQDAPPSASGVPVTVSVFAHSVSLPTFRGFLKNPNFGLRVGTEFYYRNRPGSQLLQTVNLGFYHHRALQTGLFVSTEFGYRKFFGPVYAEGLVGVGVLGLSQHLRSYQPDGAGEFRPASSFMLRAMPSLSAGLGYRFGLHTPTPVSVFTRYELFAETPFSNRGVPLLPHSALHVGTRVLLNR